MGVDYANYGVPRADLGAAMREYIAEQNTFVATKVFPMTRVVKQAGKFPVITRKCLTGRADVSRAMRSAYNRVALKAEDFAYSCAERGLEGQLDLAERSVFASDFDAEAEIVNQLTYAILREQEIRVASQLMTETVFNNSSVFAHSSTVWSNTSADIIGDVQAAVARGYALVGMPLDTLVVGYPIFVNIVKNSAIREAIKYVEGARWNEVSAALAGILGVRQVLVGGAVYDGKPEGATAASMSYVWGSTYALVCLSPESDSVTEPAIGRTFIWETESPENANVETYEEPQTRSTIIRVRQYTDEKLIDKFFGQLIDTTATS